VEANGILIDIGYDTTTLTRFPGAFVVPEEHDAQVVGVLLLAAHQVVATVMFDDLIPV